MQESEVVLWKKSSSEAYPGLDIYVPTPTPGNQVLRPGEHPKFAGIRKPGLLGKLNFLSLMLALFCGTASLPHILIRYYTVKDAAAARKSTIVGIASIGFFFLAALTVGFGLRFEKQSLRFGLLGVLSGLPLLVLYLWLGRRLSPPAPPDDARP